MELINFKTFYYWGQRLPVNNKSKEVQLYTYLNLSPQIEFDINLIQDGNNIFLFYFKFLGLFEIDISKNKNSDHAGFRVSINILGINFDYSHYDIRHWNYDNNDWEKYD